MMGCRLLGEVVEKKRRRKEVELYSYIEVI